MMKITQRRICWPTPDSVCLQGGCGYCNQKPFRHLDMIEQYAREHDLMDHYVYGLERRFCNAEVVSS